MPAARSSKKSLEAPAALPPLEEDENFLPVRPATEALNLGPLAHFPGYVLRRAQAQISQGLLEILIPFGLRRTSFAVLLLLKYNPGATPSDVADTLGLARTNFVPLLAALRKQGLAVHQPRPDDRRFRALYLTREGLALVNKIEPLAERHEAKVLQQIGPNGPEIVRQIYAWLSGGGK